MNSSPGNAGIANGQSPWGRGGAAGQQYAFIQLKGSISQTISNLIPGNQYQLKFAMARRAGGDEGNRIEILQDNISLNMVRPVDETWRTYTSPVFTATQSSHTFHFNGMISTSDCTTLIDEVRFGGIVPSGDILQNGGFEVPVFAPGGWSYEANYLEGGGWYFLARTGTTGSGIGSINSPWGNSAAEGNQFAFVQRDGYITQYLNNLVVGERYSVAFQGSIRPGFSDHTLHVLINDTNIMTTTFTVPQWTPRETASFVATSPTMTLRFQGDSEQYDTASLLDNVAVFLTPPVSRITGKVTLQTSVNQAQPITFEFRPTDGSAAFQRTVTLNTDGTYAIADIPRQTYTVWVKGEKWLAKTIALAATVSDIPNINLTLRGGDANNDNYVDISDLLLLIGSYNKTAPDSAYLDAADFNCDGSDDIFDLVLLIANYNRQGEL